MFCTVGGQPISAHPSVSFRSAATDVRYKMLNGCFRLGADIHLEPISGSLRRQSGITGIRTGRSKADVDLCLRKWVKSTHRPDIERDRTVSRLAKINDRRSQQRTLTSSCAGYREVTRTPTNAVATCLFAQDTCQASRRRAPNLCYSDCASQSNVPGGACQGCERHHGSFS